MLPHPLTNFKIQKYYQIQPKLNDIYSRNNVSKIKNGTYVINMDEYKSIGTYIGTLSALIKKYLKEKNPQRY